LDEQEKDGLPGRGLLHRQAEQQSQQRRRSLVLWNERRRVVGGAAEYRTDMEAGAALGLTWHLLLAA
jgi:hypothetical protein